MISGRRLEQGGFCAPFRCQLRSSLSALLLMRVLCCCPSVTKTGDIVVDTQ